MPVFAIVVLILTFIVLVAMLIVRSRKAEANPRRRSKQSAKRESAEVLEGDWPAELGQATADVGNDAPRMPLGDLPPRPSRRRGH